MMMFSIFDPSLFYACKKKRDVNTTSILFRFLKDLAEKNLA